jgi:alkylhydroperoxidase family enzyme
MAFIKQIAHDEAKGLLKQIYDAALKRAGRIYNILRVMSLNPPVLRDSMALYQNVMMGKSELSRARREMIATVVSWENDCFY